MIIDREDLEVWMISLLNREDVEPVRQKALDSWWDQGFAISFFDAITPNELPELNQLNLTHKNANLYYGGPKPLSDTEKAVWYSHFFLWRHCIEVDKPICIIEEDCMLTKPFPEFFMVYAAAAFCYDSKEITPCAGYILTVELAKYLVDFALTEELDFNVDHLMSKWIDDKKPLELAIQVPRDWRTIDHW